MNEVAELRSRLPKKIERLADVAYDLWWSSSRHARAVFRMVSRYHWSASEHNPIQLLKEVDPARFVALAEDEDFLRTYRVMLAHYDIECERSTKWFDSEVLYTGANPIAYFSAEYGLHSSLPIYSGGLGILAGDHVKTADELGVPLVAVGFMYPYGFFEQHIDHSGEQIAEYKHIDLSHAALQQVLNSDGSPLRISLRLDAEPTRLHLKVWKVAVGTVTIYLLDSDLDENAPSDREITRRLYGGDKIYRLRQEIALGVGGVRVLNALGIKPAAWHANEGHSAFLFVERLRNEMHAGMTFREALEHIRHTSVFTTHTIVPAGHDTFDPELVVEYFQETINELGISKAEFLSLGLHHEGWSEMFNMTALAMSMTRYHNAVSKKHQEVTRTMWPEYETMSAPIVSITNGVHVSTWLAPEMEELFHLALPDDWREHQSDAEFWTRVATIPDHILWHARKELSAHLGQFINARLRAVSDTDPTELIARGALFNPFALTIGFARRFATYKRADLLFHDPERLARILGHADRPVQIVYSGKAHPADEGGKAFIKEVWQYAQDPRFHGKVFFLENYSMHTAKFLVQGCDLWLNTPRAPLEASGTSGMKAAINGVPNLSVLDGWWLEAYNGKNGWAIDSNDKLSEQEQDAADAEQLYRMLEEQIVPLYYDRDLNHVPVKWLAVVKESIASVLPRFSSARMMRDYVAELYLPAIGKS
ncbi:MAG: alpha-glucan family phosphorylase [Bacteroidetes bacterium]|nr:alpha-glucan family phosphorylase [Bacteroidota bacterium]